MKVISVKTEAISVKKKVISVKTSVVSVKTKTVSDNMAVVLGTTMFQADKLFKKAVSYRQ